MAKLVKAIDSALGYHSSYSSSSETDPAVDMSQFIRSTTDLGGGGMSRHAQARDVQERWMDDRDTFDEAERQVWQEEARLAKMQNVKTDVDAKEAEPEKQASSTSSAS